MQTNQLLNHATRKIFSVRTYVVVTMTTTFCILAYKALNIYLNNSGNKEVLGMIENVVMFILGAFCTQIANILTAYFGRADREQQIKGGESNEKNVDVGINDPVSK